MIIHYEYNQQKQQQQQGKQQWHSLSRLLAHWSQIETLRFTGSISGPMEDFVQEALVGAPNTSTNTHTHSPTKRMLPRLKRLIMSKIGLFPFNASCIASTLVGSLGGSLVELDLSHNALKDEGLVTIFKAIAARSESSSSSSSSSSGGRRGRRSSESFHRLANLRKLDISYTQLTSAGLRALLLALTKGAMPNLRCLVVSGNNLRDDGGVILAALIEELKLPHMEVLDATACGLGPVATKTLLEASLGGGLMALQSLYVGNNYIDSQGVEALAVAIKTGKLPRLKHLRLDLSGDTAAYQLAGAWGGEGNGNGSGKGSQMPDLLRLDLAKNASLNGQAWYDLMTQGQGLPPTLRELNLAHCKRLGTHGLSGLLTWGARQADRNGRAASITFLDLSNTGLVGADEECARHLASLFSVFPALETLLLKGNQLGPEGALALAQAVVNGVDRGACKLKVLDVSENALGDEGILALSAALPLLPRLSELTLAENEMHAPSWRVLTKALSLAWNDNNDAEKSMTKARTALRVLDVSKNPLGAGVFSAEGDDTGTQEGISHLFQHLQVLKMAWAGLDGQDLATLVEILGAKNAHNGRGGVALTTLDLAYNGQIGHAGASQLLHLAFSHRLPYLRSLSLVGTGLGDAFIIQLMVVMNSSPWPHWIHMDLVDLRGNDVSKEARINFQGHISRLRGKLAAEDIWGYSRKLQSVVRIVSS